MWCCCCCYWQCMALGNRGHIVLLCVCVLAFYASLKLQSCSFTWLHILLHFTRTDSADGFTHLHQNCVRHKWKFLSKRQSTNEIEIREYAIWFAQLQMLHRFRTWFVELFRCRSESDIELSIFKGDFRWDYGLASIYLPYSHILHAFSCFEFCCYWLPAKIMVWPVFEHWICRCLHAMAVNFNIILSK